MKRSRFHLSKVFFCTILLTSMLVGLQLSAQQIWYVSQTSGSDLNAGNAPGVPFATLEKALRNAGLAPNDEIWVEQGTYIPTYIPAGANARDVTFWVDKNVKLMGGYAAGSNFATRDFLAYPTILSGDLDGNNMSNPGDAHHIMIWAAGDGQNGAIDGFIFQHGHAEVNSNMLVGGINYNRRNATVMFTQGSVVVQNSIFRENYGVYGGAIFAAGNIKLTLRENLFENNKSNYRGAAMQLDAIPATPNQLVNSLTPIIERNTFINNEMTATSDCYGVISIANVDNTYMIRNNTFTGNKSAYTSGVLYNGGTTYFYNNTVVGNTTAQGGVVTHWTRTTYYAGNIIAGNATTISGYADLVNGTSQDFNIIGATNIGFQPNDRYFVSEQMARILPGTLNGNLLTPTLTHVAGKVTSVVEPLNNIYAQSALLNVPVNQLPTFGTVNPAGAGYIDQRGQVIAGTGGEYYSGSVNEDIACPAVTQWYVDINATAEGDGTSPATAAKSLNAVLASLCLKAGDTVNVAQGTYYPEWTLLGNLERDKTFLVNKNITLLGGWNNTFGTRDNTDSASLTVLSGDLGAQDVTADNAHHVMVWSAADTKMGLLDGFLIYRGNANVASNLTIAGINYARSQAGGLYIYQGRLNITNNIFLENQAPVSSVGGALKITTGTGSKIDLIKGNWFHKNTAYSEGGAIYLDVLIYPVTIELNTFTNNISTASHAGAIRSLNTTHTIRCNTFAFNESVTGVGAAVYNTGGMNFYNNTVTGNKGSTGGAVYTGGYVEIGGNIIAGNRVTASTVPDYQSTNTAYTTNNGYGLHGVTSGMPANINGDRFLTVNNFTGVLEGEVQNSNIFVPILTSVPGHLAPVIMPVDNALATAFLYQTDVAKLNVWVPKNSTNQPIDQTYTPILTASGRYNIGSVNRNITCPSSNVWYVDMNAPIEGDGSTAAAPSRYLSAILDLPCLKVGDTVKVAQGTYYGSMPLGSTNSQDAVSLVTKSIHLLGGYKGFDGTVEDFSAASRDIVNNKTILSADVNNNLSTAAFHVVIWDASNDNAVGTFEGFTLRDGRAMNTSVFNNMYRRDCGAGFYHAMGKLRFLSNIVFNNIAYYAGGGMYVNGELQLLRGNWFDQNISSPNSQSSGLYGGGAAYFTLDAGTIIELNTFTNNQCLNTYSSAGRGGALFFASSSSNLFTVRFNTFAYNTAYYMGGAIASYGNVVLYNNTIIGNQALTEYGGAIRQLGGTFALRGNVVVGNQSANLSYQNFYGTFANNGYNLMGMNTHMFHAQYDRLVRNMPSIGLIYDGVPYGGNLFWLDFDTVPAPGVVAPAPKLKQTDYAMVMMRNLTLDMLNNSTGSKNSAGAWIDQRHQSITAGNTSGMYYSGSVNDNTMMCVNNPNKVWYVDINAPDNGDGLTPATAYNDLSALLNISCLKSADTIKIAEGTYIPTISQQGSTDRRDITFNVTLPLVFLGGYDATFNEAGRNPAAHPTILSGNYDNSSTNAANAYHVMTWKLSNANDTRTGIIDGLIIQEGNANVNSNFLNLQRNYGGGLLHRDGVLRIRNSRFLNNNAEYGGAVYVQDGQLKEITSSHFAGNTVVVRGGAVYFNNAPGTNIHLNTFDGNETTYQSADRQGGALYFAGNGTALFYLRHNTFTNNKANYSEGAAVYNAASYLQMFNNTIAGNTGATGPAVRQANGAITMGGNIIAGNLTVNSGNADFYRSGGTVTNNGFNVIYDYNASGFAFAATDIRVSAGELTEVIEGSLSGRLFVPQLTDIPDRFAPVVLPRDNMTARTVLQRVPIAQLPTYGISDGSNYIDQKYSIINNSLAYYYSGAVNSHPNMAQACPNVHTWYVSMHGTGDGSSLSTPANDLEMVLASPCFHHGDTVKIAEGIYYPTFNMAGSIYDRDRAFLVDRAAYIFGGYDSLTFDDATRATCGGKTILDGDWDHDDNVGNNTYHIMLWNVPNSLAGEIDGITFRNGCATENRNIFTNVNQQNGAGLYFNGGRLTVRNSRFLNNVASGNGTALFATSGRADGISTLTVSQSLIQGNQPTDGSAGNGTFYFNNLNDPSNPLYSSGINHCTFTGNTAAGVGSAVYSTGGKLMLVFNTILNNSSNGTSGNGSAVYHTGNTSQTLQMYHNTILGNFANSVAKSYAVYINNTPYYYGANIIAGNVNSASPNTSADFGTGGSASTINYGYNILPELSTATVSALDKKLPLDILANIYTGSVTNNRLVVPLKECFCSPVAMPVDSMSGYIQIVPVESSENWMDVYTYGESKPAWNNYYDQCNVLLDPANPYYLAGSVNVDCESPILTNPGNFTLCNSDLLTIPLTSNKPNTLYSWKMSDIIGASAGAVKDTSWHAEDTLIHPFHVINNTQSDKIVTVKVIPVYNKCEGDTVTFTITIHPTPVIDLEAGSGVCFGNDKQITAAVTSGSTATIHWYSEDPGTVSIVGATNAATITVHGVVLTTPTNIWCVVENASGCKDSAVVAVTVNQPNSGLPEIQPATKTICEKETFTFTFAVGANYGYWKSMNPAIATIDPQTGVVTGVAGSLAGTSVTIKYVYDNGCIDSTKTAVLTVLSNAPIDPITAAGSTTLCKGSTVQLSNTTAGGTWSSDSTVIATVDASGLVTAVGHGTLNGTTMIRYNVPNSNGCTDNQAIRITVWEKPTVSQPAAVEAVCAGNKITVTVPTVTLHGAAVVSGGWLLNGQAFNPAVQNVTYAHNNGDLQYYVTSTCGNDTSIVRKITVHDVPQIGTLAAPDTICRNSKLVLGTSLIEPAITLRGVPVVTKQWLIGAPAATGGTVFDPAVKVWTLAESNTQIYFRVTTECGVAYSNGTRVIISGVPTIAPLPAPINLCEQTALTLTPPVVTKNNSKITEEGWKLDGYPFNTSALLSTNDHGKILTYYVYTTCDTVSTGGVPINVHAAPVITSVGTTSGESALCMGGQVRMAGDPQGGTWVSILGRTSVSGDLVTGITAGEDEIRYTVVNGNGCSTSKSVYLTVRPLPEVINLSAPDSVCKGSSAAFEMAFDGTPPFTITMNTGANNITRTANAYSYTEVVNNVTDSAMLKVIRVRDSYGCGVDYGDSTLIRKTVYVYGLPDVSIHDTSTCSGGNAGINIYRQAGYGSISVNYSVNGTPGYSTIIPDGSPFGVASIFNVTGNVDIQINDITDANGCKKIYTAIDNKRATISIRPLPQITFAAPNSVCMGSIDSLTFTRGTGSAEPANIVITYTENDVEKTATIPAGAHFVKVPTTAVTDVTHFIVISVLNDSTLCENEYVSGNAPQKSINPVILPEVSIESPGDVCYGTNGQFRLNRLAGAGAMDVKYTINGGTEQTAHFSNGQSSILVTIPNITVCDTVTVTEVLSLASTGCATVYTASDRPEVFLCPQTLPDATVEAEQDTVCYGDNGSFVFRSNIDNVTIFYTINGGTTNSIVIPQYANEASVTRPALTVNQIVRVMRVVSNLTGCQTAYTALNMPIDTIAVLPQVTLNVTGLSRTGSGPVDLSDAVVGGEDPAYTYTYYSNANLTQVVTNPANVSTSRSYWVKKQSQTAPYCEIVKEFTVTIVSTTGFSLDQEVNAVCMGDTAEFVLTLTNGGDAAANLQVSMAQGANLNYIDYVNATSGSTYSAAAKMWTVPTLASGASASVTLRFVTNAVSPEATLRNMATLIISNGDTLLAADRVSSIKAVKVNAIPTASLSLDNSQICLGSNVTMTLNLTGTAPFSIVYSTGSGDVTRNNVPNIYTETAVNVTAEKAYSLTQVSDANGCSRNYAAPALTDTVKVNALPEVSIDGDTVCVGSDGSITFTKTAGSGTVEVFYNVQGSPAGSVVIPAGSTTGAATVYGVTGRTSVQITRISDSLCDRVYNGNGQMVYITTIALPAVSMTVPSRVCQGGDATVHFQRTETTGITTIQYVVNDVINKIAIIDNGDISVDSVLYDIEDLTVVRIISVSYSETGCVRNYEDNGPVRSIAVIARPEVGLESLGDVCYGGDGSFKMNRLAGTGALLVTYTVNGGTITTVHLANGQNSLTQQVLNVTVNDTVRITDIAMLGSSACTYTYDPADMPMIVIHPVPLPDAAVAVETDPICYGEDGAFIISSASDNLTISYTLNGGAANTVVIPQYGSDVRVALSGLTADRILRITRVVNNAMGCHHDYSAGNEPSSTLHIQALPVLNVQNISRTGSGNVDLTSAVVGGHQTGYTYTYYGNAALSQLIGNPTATNVTATGNYWVKIKDNASPYCENVQEFTVTIVSTAGFSIDQEVEAICMGDTAEFIMTLTNGGDNATNMQVSNLPGSNLSYIDYINAAPGSSYNDVSRVWTVPTLTSGASASITLRYLAAALSPEASLRNTATLIIANGDTLRAVDRVSSIATLRANAIPTASISLDNSEICSGSNVTMTLNLTGAAPFSVDYSINGIAYHRNNVPNLYNEVATNVTANRYYEFMTVSDNHGCAYTYAAPLKDSVVVNALPTATLAPDTVCVGDDASILFTRGTGAGTMEIFYNVQGSPAGSVVIPSGSTTASATVFGITSRTIVQITRITDSLCEHIYSGNGHTAYIETIALPVATVAVSPATCMGSDGWARFSRPVSTGEWTVTYTVNDGTAQNATVSNGTTSTQVPVPNITEQTTVKIVSVTNVDNGCTRNYDYGTEPSAIIGVRGLPEVLVTDPDFVCYGTSANLRFDRINGTGKIVAYYTTNFGSDSIIMIGTALNTHLLNITVPTYFVLDSVRDNYCMNRNAEDTSWINVHPLPSVYVDAVYDTVCYGSEAMFRIYDSAGMATADWTIYYNVNGVPASTSLTAGQYSTPVIVSSVTNVQYLIVTKVEDRLTGCTNPYYLGIQPYDSVVPLELPDIIVQNLEFTGTGARNLTDALVAPDPEAGYTYSYYSNAALTQHIIDPTSVLVNATRSYWVKKKMDDAPYCEIVGEFTVTVVSTSGFSIEQNVEPVCLGDTAEFVMTLSNIGYNANDLHIVNTAGTNLQFIDFSPVTANYNPATNEWTIASLPSGSFESITLRYLTLAVSPEASLRNTATLFIANGDTLYAFDRVNSVKAVTVYPNPSASLSLDNAQVCSGSNVTMTLNLTGASPFSVDYSINGIAYHRNNVPNLYNEVATNVTANRYYEFMTVSDNHGCAYTYAAPLKDSVVVNALPTATLAPDTVCVGDDASILFTRGTGAGTMEIFYNVQSSPAGSVVIPSGSTTASATVFGVTSRTIVQITRITDSLCEHIYSGNGPINYISVTALPSVSILAPSIVCHGAYAVVTFGRSTTDSVTTVNYVVNDITNGTVNIPHGVNTVNDTIWNIEETTTVRILSVYYSGTGCTRNYDENGPMKTIAVATKPEIGLSAVGDACLNGDATFTIDRLIGSGAMAITYTVNGANPVVVNMLNGQNSVTQTISPLSSIDTVRVTNVHVLGTNNCNYAYVDSLMPTLVLIPQPLPVASITPVDDSICAGETAVFILESLGSNSEDWSVFYKVNGQATSAVIPAFVNQVSVTVPNASANQVIEINRIVKNTTGCQTIYTAANAPRDTIVVSPKPAVSFTNHVVSLGQLQFTSLANAAEIASWEWDFGDGYTSNDTNPLHTYAGTAVYDVCLTVTSVSGCVNTICKEITVNTVLDLAVDFNINNASQCLNGNLFSFNNTSSISTSGYYLDRYFWDFGDGTTDTLRHGLHTYSDVGTYIVKLVVWEAPGGSSDSITKVVRVVGKPIITDGAAPAPVCDGSLLSVNQPAVDWRGNTPFAGTWMLDSIIFDPFSTPVYMADDGKILRYRVESVCGDTVSVGVPITVIPRLTLDTVPNLTLCSGDTLDYTPAATGGTNPSFSWQRLSNALVTQVPTSGDSTIHEVLTSLSNNPLQVYYNVTINNQGCTSTQTITAVVNPVPVLTSSTDPVTLCNGQPFVYSVQTSTSGATFAWTRGTLRTNPANSGTANYINEVLVNDTTIPIVAKYFITLSYGSCSTIDSIEVTINPAVTVTSMLVPDSICSKSFFNYEITTDAANASFAWHRLPNANIVEPVSSGIDALITEQLTSRADTDVVVTYIVNIAANGCQSAATAIQVKVKPLPTLVIATQTPLLMYIGDVDTVAINTNGTLISWVSNDSTIARVDTAHSQLLITALTEGITTIKLIAENEAGCRDENSFIVNVNAPPVATIDLTNGQVTEFCSASPVTLQFEIAGGNAPYEVVYARIHNNDTIEYTVNNVLQSVHQFTVMLPANDSNFVDTVVYQLISVVDANSHSLVIVPNDIVLNILPKSKVDTIGNIIVCEGTNVEIPAFTTPTIPGTSVHYTWYNNNQAVGLVMSGQVAQGDSIPAFLAANPMDIPATAKITVTPYFTGTTKVCQGDAMTFDITVNSKPDFTVTNPLPICAGTAYNPNADIATLIQTLKPTSAVVTFYRDVTCLDTIKATDIDVFNSTTTIYARATSVDACESDVKSIVVTVQSLELAGNTHISVCSGETFNYVANSTWNNTNYTWERPAIDGISNPAVSGTGANISERLILDDTVTTYYTAIYAFTMQSATCQAYDTLRVDVYPAAHLTTLLDTICSGDSISYLPDAGALNAITTFEWTRFENANIAQPISSGTGAINERLTNTSNHSVVVIYEYIITTGTCSHRENFRVIVNPTPKPNVLHQRFDPICSNSIFTAELTNSVAEANIMWQRVPNADITPDVNLAVFNSGSHIEDTLTNGTQNVVTVFYHVEYEAYGCTFVDTVSVDVNPLPIMTGNHTPDAICSGTAFNYLIETAPSNTTVTWMRAINDSIAELPVVGNTKLIAETLTNIRDTATTVKYIVSIANGLCVKEDSLSVIVNPFPTVAVLNDTTVCHADSIVITPTGTATKYIFTTSTHIGMANSVEIVQGSVLTFETANTTGAPLTATITVTPVYESGINSCYGHTSTFKITVNPLPGLTPVEDMAFCAGSSVPSYQFTGLTAGANYTWQRIAGNAITSLPTQGINSLPAFTANNLTDSFLVATYEVSATHTYNGVTCSYNRDTFNITVYNQAILSPMEDVEVCALSETDTIFFTGSNNTVFDWIKVSGVNIGSPLVGTGNFMPPFTAQNNNSYVRSATYTVTPRIAGTACIGTARNFTIYVNPTAVLSSAIYNDTLCSGELFEYTATSVTNNVLYRWSRPVVVGINNGVAVSNQGNVIREVLTNSADTTITVPYYISLTHENCTHIDTIYVPVKAAQMLSLDTNNFVVCQGTAQFNVTFTLSNPSLPTNYKLVFDNNANMQGLFSMTSYQALTSDTSIIVSMPNAIAPGNYTATLYIETNGCTQSVGQNFVITVLQGTVITKEPRAIEVLCENYGALHLEVNALGTNVTYQWYHDGTAISGATTSVYDVESPTATEYGEYYVVVSGECGEDTSITVQVIDNFVQIGVMWTDVLFVSNNDTNMLALEFAYYQWYKWNEAAGKFVSIYRNSDAQSFYEPDGLGGMYMVEIFYKNGESFMSCPFIYTIQEEVVAIPTILYPNPAPLGIFNVQLGDDFKDMDLSKLTIEVTTLSGTVVGTTVPTDRITEVRMGLAPAVYVVKVKNASGKVMLTTKVVVK